MDVLTQALETSATATRLDRITVIGAGTMGNGIAHVFALAGCQVSLVDKSHTTLSKARAVIEKNLDRQLTKGTITEQQRQATASAIHYVDDLGQVDANQALVVEAVTENVELKKVLFQQMDKHFSAETILSTNTSSISITMLAAVTKRPEKVIGMHFMNPVPVMKLVEVIKGYSTSEGTTRAIVEMVAKLGKTAVASNDYPGFVANRILMPMINEAVQTLFEGVAGVDEIDQIMKLGMAHPMGPLQLADFIGLDVCLSILNVLYSGFKQPRYAPCPLLVNMVAAGKLGAKTGEGFYVWSEGKAAGVSRMLEGKRAGL